MVLPSVPRPLTAINSPFDDFNAAAPDVADGTLVFSTNRGTQGGTFDLWRVGLKFEEDRVVVTSPLQPFEPQAMSPANELGPAFFERKSRNVPSGTLVFGSDRPGGAGGFDLYTWPVRDLYATSVPQPPAPLPMPGVNTAGYEGYWAHAGSGPALFASDRAGRGLDAFELSPPLGASASGSPPTITRVDALSSDADDTAFHLVQSSSGYRVLFASNRPGGQGDYDLYCAEYHYSGGWQAPVLLAYASSPQRDFRPIVFEGYLRDVLLFSSDRPGGQGGMDLYYVALAGPCAGGA